MNKIISCDINSSLSEIANCMKEHNIGFLPIKENNKIIGVITDRDIVTRILSNNDNKIKGYLTTNLITIDINESVDNLINLMNKNKIKRILVTKKDNIVGVISLSDIINKYNIYQTIINIFNIKDNEREHNVSIDTFEL